MADAYTESETPIVPDSGQPAEQGLPASQSGPAAPRWTGESWVTGGRQTIASLGLNMEAARTLHVKLFPRDLQHSVAGEAYPLPSDLGELFAVASLHLPKWAKDNVAAYVRRARKAYKTRCISRNLTASEKNVAKMASAAASLAEIKRDAAEEIRAAAASVVNLATETATKFSELDELHKAGMQRIMAAFVAGEPLDGEMVTPEQFTSCARVVSGYKSRVGAGVLDQAAKSEAEGAIFEEVSAATRARLAASMPVPDGKPS